MEGKRNYDDSVLNRSNNPLSLDPVPISVPSSVASRTSGGTSDVLPEERKSVSFDVEEMTQVLYGGPKKVAKRRFIIDPINKTELYLSKYDLDRPQLFAKHFEHFNGIHRPFLKNYKPTREEIGWMYSSAVVKGPLSNHFNLFISTIEGQGTEEQKNEYLQRSRQMNVIGCYAQTELGHGSNVRGLETVAQYEHNTKTFLIHSPTLTSIKWWPGALGKVATHAVVYAQLLIPKLKSNGFDNKGVHALVVQIRDENHRPLPGIEVGDLGAKLGDHGNDTGFLRLTNVRVHKNALLSRYQYISEAGEYIINQNERKAKGSKAIYDTMVITRAQMVDRAHGAIAKAVTIATRYSIVRKQGFEPSNPNSNSSKERRLIDWTIQRKRIFKQLTNCYAMRFAARWMYMVADSKDVENYKEIDVVELAAMSAGLKAVCTVWADKGIEDLRKCCGGNGYLMSSGLAGLAADYTWQTTAEGDFVVMMLLAARWLIKVLRNKINTEVCWYLSYDVEKTNTGASEQVRRVEEVIVENVRSKLINAEKELRELQKKRGEEAWNDMAIELCNVVEAHVIAFMWKTFIDTLSDTKKSNTEQINKVLEDLLLIWGAIHISDNYGFGVLNPDKTRYFNQMVTDKMGVVRKDMIGLVDALDIPDLVLNSAIGKADGNVYEALYEAAKRSLLNHSDPFYGYDTGLKPLLDLQYLEKGRELSETLRNKAAKL